MNADHDSSPLSRETEDACLALVGSIDVLLQRIGDHDTAWLATLGLTGNAGRVALRLLVQGPSTATDLTRYVAITSAGMTTLIDRLEAQQFVMRRRHPTDRRRMLIFPSKRLQASFFLRNAARAELVHSGMKSDVSVRNATRTLASVGQLFTD